MSKIETTTDQATAVVRDDLYMADGRFRPSATLLVGQVAQVLQCHPETVRRLAVSGKLRPVPGLRILRFSGAELNRYLG